MQSDQEKLIQVLTETIECLKQQNDQQQKLITQQNQQISELTQEILSLRETIECLRHKIFGASSEKTGSLEEKPEIMDVFNEAEASADPSVKEPDAETMVGGYIRKKKGKSKTPRKELLKNLPIEKIICRNPEEDHICELCESEMIPFSEKFIREEIQIIPAKIKRIHYYQEILLCPACKKEHDEFVTAAAETPSPLMLHSPASPSTVAYIMYQKYANAMPLYRQEKDWLQMGVKLHRATMANWINKCTLDYLKPVYDRLHEYLILREILHADEVPCQVLHEDGKTAASKSYMWIYLTGDDGEPGITLYEYQPGRSGDYPKQFLRGFHGFLHCDAYQGYNKLEEVIRIGCFAHCRRYFFDAIPKDRKKQSKELPAEIGVAYCNRLFEIERELKDLSPEERKAERLTREHEVLDEFRDWLDTVKPLGGSRLAKAVTYARNQRENLEGYLQDGRCELSNSAAERKAKSYVIGRKNFLFHDTVKGAEASAIIYSLVETAKMNKLNIYQYLYTLLLYMPDYKNEPEGIEELMPWSEFIKVSCSSVEYEEPEVRLKN